MTEEQANAIADALGGDSWQSGGGIYVVMLHRRDGRLIVLTDECVCEYENDEAFDNGQAIRAIELV